MKKILIFALALLFALGPRGVALAGPIGDVRANLTELGVKHGDVAIRVIDGRKAAASADAKVRWVTLTRGMLRWARQSKYPRYALAAVVVHEIGHIRNGHVRRGILAQELVADRFAFETLSIFACVFVQYLEAKRWGIKSEENRQITDARLLKLRSACPTAS